MNEPQSKSNPSAREKFSKFIAPISNPISIILLALMLIIPLIVSVVFSPEAEFGFFFFFALLSINILLSVFVIYQGHRQKSKLKLHFLFIINGFYSLFLGMLTIYFSMGDPANMADYSYELEMQLARITELFLICSLTYSFLTLIASLFFIFTSKDHSLLFYSTMFITTFHGISVISILTAFSMARGFILLCFVFYFTPIVLDILIAMSIVSNRNRVLKRFQTDGIQ